MNDTYDTYYTYYIPTKKQDVYVADHTNLYQPPTTRWVSQTDGLLVYEPDYEEIDFLKEKLEAVLDFLVDSGMSRDDVIDHFGLEDYYVK